MRLEAIYNHGRLELSLPVQFKHDRVRLVVDVPDEDVALQPNPHMLPNESWQRAQQMLARFEAIRNAPLPPDDELPPLTPKQIERIEAFELRAQLREDQGRAA